MSQKTIYRVIVAVAIVCCAASCKIKNASEEAKEQAHNTEGIYDVTGVLELGPLGDGEGENAGKTLDFSGHGTAINLGNAVMDIRYISDKTGDTNNIIADIDEDGNILFRNFNIDYNGVTCKTTMHSSHIRRYGTDTIAGSGSCTMTIFSVLSRDADLDVMAIRRKNTNK